MTHLYLGRPIEPSETYVSIFLRALQETGWPVGQVNVRSDSVPMVSWDLL